jgi:small subunit ribosomal protein S4
VARYKGPVCRLCRSEGTKLFLKGKKCYTKCTLEKRNYPPGYALRLREKQKTKRIYGLLERQFKNYFKKAERQAGITGENLLRFLERRLDNVVFRLGFATSRNQARQLIRHGHFLVNNRKVDIPSYLIKQGDEVVVKKSSTNLGEIKEARELSKERGIPPWLRTKDGDLKGQVLELPSREQIDPSIQEQLIVELYSK